MSVRSWVKDVASSLFFDNSTNGFISTDVQAAIEEVNNNVITSASPGFSFGRSSNVTSGTFLTNESVPSNISGRWIYIYNPRVTSVFVSNENNTTYKVDVLYHTGNGAGMTLLGSVTVTAAYGASFSVNWPAIKDTQIAVRLAEDSPNSAKNIVCGLELTGTLTP